MRIVLARGAVKFSCAIMALLEMKRQKLSGLVKFFAELGMSRRLQRSGPHLSGIKHSENIAEHVFRAAQIAYCLAVLERVDPEKTACLVLFCNNPQLRLGDQDKVAARYYSMQAVEPKALKDQTDQLPSALRLKLTGLFQEFKQRRTREAVIAKDADWLATAIEAKEYVEQGYPSQQEWLDHVREALETKLAREILKLIEATENFTSSWWQNLQKMTYRKLGR